MEAPVMYLAVQGLSQIGDQAPQRVADPFDVTLYELLP